MNYNVKKHSKDESKDELCASHSNSIHITIQKTTYRAEILAYLQLSIYYWKIYFIQ